MSQRGGEAGTSSNKRWRSWDEFRGTATKGCLQRWRRDAASDLPYVERKAGWEHPWRREARWKERGNKLLHIPKFTANWLGSSRIYKTTLSPFKKKFDKPVPVPKEHFGDISGGATKISGIKRHRGLEMGGYLHFTFNYHTA